MITDGIDDVPAAAGRVVDGRVTEEPGLEAAGETMVEPADPCVGDDEWALKIPFSLLSPWRRDMARGQSCSVHVS
jgi:hypothetical protein